MSEVDPLAQSQKMTTRYEGGRCVGRADEMGMSSVKRSWKVLGLVILEPIALVDIVVPHVVGMTNIKFNEEAAVLQASRMKRDRVI